MGTGTKIGIILILILVVVVIANLLDSEVQRGPSAEQQVTGNGTSNAPAPVVTPRRTVRPAVNNERKTIRPVQAPRVVTESNSSRKFSVPSGGSTDVVKVSNDASDGQAAIQPAVSRNEEVGISRATGVIRSGGQISSPRGSTSVKPLPAPVRTPVPVETVKKRTIAKLETITVQEGDSLWSIASRHLGSGLRWTELVKVNPGLSENSIVQPGQKMNLPAAKTVAAANTAAETAVVSTPQGFRSVVIRKGDTLYGLADEHMGSYTRWEEIEKANPGIDPGRLPVGKKILIPR